MLPSYFFFCAFVTIFTAKTLKMTHEAKRNKLREDMRKFLRDVENIYEWETVAKFNFFAP